MAGPDQAEQGDLTEVRRCSNRRQAEQYALVLTAMGIQSLIAQEAGFLTLYVAHKDSVRAGEELAAYDSENREWPLEKNWMHPALPGVEVALVYWAVLLFASASASTLIHEREVQVELPLRPPAALD